jgi:hypothetical protein
VANWAEYILGFNKKSTYRNLVENIEKVVTSKNWTKERRTILKCITINVVAAIWIGLSRSASAGIYIRCSSLSVKRVNLSLGLIY